MAPIGRQNTVVLKKLQNFTLCGICYLRTCTTQPRAVSDLAGIGSFYKGLSTALVRSFPANAALFLAYEATKRQLGRLAGI